MKSYEEWLAALGANLQDSRQDLKLTQAAAAERCRLDLKYYQDVEYGRRPITTRTMYRIATALGLDIRELVPATPDDSFSTNAPAVISERAALVGRDGRANPSED